MSKKDDITARLKEQVSLLPDEPGVYRFLDEQGVVIYVGKAKNLKKRVSSYFLARAGENRKTMMLVRNIRNIVHTVVLTEADALLLENNMIKSHQPKYNILLKDDKTFPWIVVKNEEYPRVLQTRQLVRDGSHYFGPYASVMMQKNILDLVRKLYRLRTCQLRLTEKTVKDGKFDLCLEYHIGNCKAPCVGYQTKEEYCKAVEAASSILRGNLKEAEEYLKGEMSFAAENLRYEEAQQIKERLAMLENYQSRSVIVSPQYADLDVFYLITDGALAYCNYMHVAKGAVINSYTIEMKLGIEESPQQVLTFAVSRIMDKLQRPLSHEVIVPFLPDAVFGNVRFIVPVRGDKLKLLSLSERNCKIFRLEKLKQLEKVNPERHVDRIMERMQKDLHLPVEPRYIECFDNSNIQGNYPVSSCVVFRNGKPSKKEYRHFNIKTVVGIDDFASMQETLTRRYTRLLEEKAQLPDLIVVDGGKGQLSSAYEVLEKLHLQDKISIIGLAKRLEEVFYPGDSTPLYLDKSSETLKVLMHIRDEAHRFGITFHRHKRSLGFIKSELLSIPSLGPKSTEKLLRRFKSVAGIKKASSEELSQVVGPARSEIIKKFFSEKNEEEKERMK